MRTLLAVVLVFSVLCPSFFTVFARPTELYYAEYRNLGYHGLDNVFSSLTVSGTVILYDDYNLKPTANTIAFTDTSVPNLIAYHRGSFGNWDNIIESLKVNGNITLYEDPDYRSRRATFTSSGLSYDHLGTEWNKNPALLKGDDAWDCRTWHWSVAPLGDLLDVFHGNQENYVNWDSDGLVVSRAQDGALDSFKASNFDQGYERYDNEIYDLQNYGWARRACSLRVDGRVTLFENIGYNGANKNFTFDTSLTPYGWANRASSLMLSTGSRVTLYEAEDYLRGGSSISFVSPSYQPPDLTISDKEKITLEGIVCNWSYTAWVAGFASWTGAKFDVFAVEDRYNHSSNQLMLELYFLRMGGNLLWSDCLFRHDKNNYNCLASIDCFPERVERTICPGNIAKWKIDVKSFIQDACNRFPSLDINKLKIVKMSFTLESAWNGLAVNPMIECSLNRLRLAYTRLSPTSNRMWLDPSFTDVTGKNSGYRFNVTLWADLTVPSRAWQAKMLFNTNFLKISRAGYTGGSKSLFFNEHTTSQITPLINNSRGSFLFAECLIGSDSRSAGSGSLCWIELEMLVPPTSTDLGIDNNDTLFLDAAANPIICRKYGASVGKMGWKLSVDSAHGSPSPSVGDCYYDYRAVVTCSVVTPVTEAGTLWNCTGWTGTGSVPPNGDGTFVTFNITQDSSIVWNWTLLGATSTFPRIYCNEYSFSTLNVSVGSTFDVEILVSNWSAPGVYAYSFSLTYNKTLLEPVSAELPTGHWLTPTLGPGNIFVVDPGTINETGGFVSFAATLLGSEPGKTDSGVLTAITFRILELPSENVTLACDLKPVDVIMVDSSTTLISPDSYTIVDGRFVLSWEFQWPTDLNGDRKVNILDVTIVAAAFNTRPGDARWNALADLDKNEWVNIIDISKVARDNGKTP